MNAKQGETHAKQTGDNCLDFLEPLGQGHDRQIVRIGLSDVGATNVPEQPVAPQQTEEISQVRGTLRSEIPQYLACLRTDQLQHDRYVHHVPRIEAASFEATTSLGEKDES